MCPEKRRRNTRQRQVILEELQSVTSHPTAVDLYEMVRQRLPKVSLGTVYRNLELLSQRGTIRKLSLGSGEARFDGNPDRHYHIRCVRCGRVDDLSGLSSSLIENQPVEGAGYEILGHRLEFIGTCPDCQNGCGLRDRRDATQAENETTSRPGKTA